MDTVDSGPLGDSAERQAIFNVLDSYRQYRRQTHFGVTHRRRQNFYALSREHQDLLNSSNISFLDTLSTIDNAIDDNADIADAILAIGLESFGLPEQQSDEPKMNWHDQARPLDLNKAHSTIKQFWRDWSSDGFEREVKPVLNLILGDLTRNNHASASETKLLLPGAGLGRLLLELCLAGFNAEGNEISYHQLFASNFVLNTTDRADQYKLYPFVNSFNNHTSRDKQLYSVTIPDIHPATVIASRMQAGEAVGQMGMSAGDFITSYATPSSTDSFHAVITVYFVDTAPNVIRYIETIRNCLQDDGLWINVGPLLWHFEDRVVDKHDVQVERNTNDAEDSVMAQDGIAEPGSFELTDEEVLKLVQHMGFEIISHEMLGSRYGGYMQDPESMSQHLYQCSHWVARKISH